MKFEFFKKQMNLLELNFNFKYPPELMLMLFEALRKDSSEDFVKKITNEILRETTMEHWNKSYGYAGKPAIADFLKAFTPPKPQKEVIGLKKDEYGRSIEIWGFKIDKPAIAEIE